MNFILFFKIIAWVFCIGSGVFTLLRMWAWYDYNCTKGAHIRRSVDAMNGRSVSFPIIVPGMVFIISLATIISM